MKLPLLLAVVLGAAGCAPIYSDADVVYASPDGYDGSANLIDMAPGVQVAAGWDQPMFFVDNSWWWWDDGTWMMWGGNGWGWRQPPMALGGIRDPWRYRSWGAPGIIRDHRSAGRGSVRGAPPARWNGSGVSPTRWHGGRNSGAHSSGSYRGGGSSGRSTIRDHRRR